MFKIIKIDLIEEIRRGILENPNFDSDKFSLHQGEILIKSGQLIQDEIHNKSVQLTRRPHLSRGFGGF